MTTVEKGLTGSCNLHLILNLDLVCADSSYSDP